MTRIRGFSHRLMVLATLSLALGLSGCQTPVSKSAQGSAVSPARQDWQKVITLTQDGGVMVGNPQAAIRLVEYGSLSCPHCARFHREAKQELFETFVASGDLSFEFRSFVIHPQDVPLTLLVTCAPKERFFPLINEIYVNFDQLMDLLLKPGVLPKAEAAMALPDSQRFVVLADVLGYTAFFAKRGLPKSKSHACLADPAAASTATDYAQKYSDAGINATPTFLINGAVQNANTWQELRPLLAANINRSRNH